MCFSCHLTFSGMWEVCWLLQILQRAVLARLLPQGRWWVVGPNCQRSLSLIGSTQPFSSVNGLAIDFLLDLSLPSYQQLPVLNRRNRVIWDCLTFASFLSQIFKKNNFGYFLIMRVNGIYKLWIISRSHLWFHRPSIITVNSWHISFPCPWPMPGSLKFSQKWN